MTRLLSNIIKRNYIFYNPSEQAVIDSDSRLNNFTPLSFARVEDFTPKEEEMECEPNEPEEEMVHAISEVEAKAAIEQILVEAENEANAIIENAKVTANELYEDAVSRGRQQGYEQGLLDAEAMIEQKKQEMEQERLAMQNDFNRQIKELEPKFAELTIDLIRKITGVMVEDKKDLIMYLVSEALKPIRGPKQFLIRVSNDDITTLTSKKEQLLELIPEDATLEILEDSTLAKNQCFIETEDRLLDVSLDVQLSNLAEHLKILAYS